MKKIIYTTFVAAGLALSSCNDSFWNATKTHSLPKRPRSATITLSKPMLGDCMKCLQTTTSCAMWEVTDMEASFLTGRMYMPVI